MSDSSVSNLSVLSPSMGQIVFQPKSSDKEEIQNATLAIFPNRISREEIPVVIEWAAGTQTPIFCNALDIPMLEGEGFGAYRFHRLDSYREVDFQKGSIEFFPARRWKARGWKATAEQALEYFGFLKVPSFHVLIRPKNERPILFLASPQLDGAEWTMFSSHKPAIIIGTDEVPASEWKTLSKALSIEITLAADVRSVRTLSDRGRADELTAVGHKDMAKWVANLGT